MKSNQRWVLAMVLLFTVTAVGMLWGMNQRMQDELRTQVIARAAQRSEQLADAMAGQVAAELALMDHVLLDARSALLLSSAAEQSLPAQTLAFLPDGLVSNLTLVNAEGRVVYSNRRLSQGLDVSDQPHFKALQSGADRMLVGAPGRASIDEEWLIPIGRPLYRDGRFDGAIFLLLSADRMAQRLGYLALDKADIVALVNPDGTILARSLDNGAAMGQVVPADRPFLQARDAVSGHYWQHGAVDQVARVYGWHRLEGSGVVLAVGLAEASVLAPLASVKERALWLTGALSALLMLGGLAVAWLLWRDGRNVLAMRESERLLRGAQRMAKLGHWSQDLRTGVIVWSEEVHRIFETGPKGLPLETSALIDRVHPDDRQGLVAEIKAATQACGAMSLVHRIVLPDGRVKHVRVQCIFESEGESGVAVRNHGTVQDITEVREAQSALKELNEKLEGRVEARTRELASVNKELEAFSYSVSHDLRTPLRSIHGFASLLEDESETLSIEGRTHLRRIQEGARRMGLLITDLLTMAHQSRAVVHLQRLNLSELALAVAQDIEREDPQRRVAWRIEPDLWAWVDPVLMRVVLQNLLGNAWKYTQQEELAEISLRRVGPVGGMTEFCVRDNGAGFDMAYVDQLFQPFKRLHAHHEFEGTGVGLASVQRLIQRHGGTVRAEGAVGQGAALYFTLPSEPEAYSPTENGSA